MSATFNKLVVGTSALALLVLANGASAAPSLGYPAGRPYYGSTNRQSGSQSFRSYSPSYSSETRQSFSYEPAESAVKGDCGCNGQVVVPQAAETKKDVAAAPKTTRRSYSYEPATEPAPRVRNYNRSSAPKKDPWLYPKGDPRRYGR